jgi:citrate lyase gamma subunit
VDGLRLPNIGLMPTGAGGLMLSLNAKVRKRLGKDIGDVVTVRLQGPSA